MTWLLSTLCSDGGLQALRSRSLTSIALVACAFLVAVQQYGSTTFVPAPQDMQQLRRLVRSG
eukprot:1449063-Amphidinium_carterae.1